MSLKVSPVEVAYARSLSTRVRESLTVKAILGSANGNRPLQLLRPFQVAIRLAVGDGARSGKLGGCLGKLLVTQQLSGKIESLCFLGIAGSGHVTYIYNLL